MGACCSSYKPEKEERNDVDRYSSNLRMSIAETRRNEDSASFEKILKLKVNMVNHSTSPHLLFSDNYEELNKYACSQRLTIDFKWIAIEDIWNMMAASQDSTYQSEYIIYNHCNSDLNVSSSSEEISGEATDKLFVAGRIKLYKLCFYNIFCRFKQLNFDLTKHLSNDIRVRLRSFLENKRLIILFHQTSFSMLDIILSKIIDIKAKVELYVAAFDYISSVSFFDRLMSNDKESLVSNIASICEIQASNTQQFEKFGITNSNLRILSLLEHSVESVVPYLLINLECISWLNSKGFVYIDKQKEENIIDTGYACLVKKLKLKVITVDLKDLQLKKGLGEIKQSSITFKGQMNEIKETLINSDLSVLLLLEKSNTDSQKFAKFIVYFLYQLTGIPVQQLQPFITDNPFLVAFLGCNFTENDFEFITRNE